MIGVDLAKRVFQLHGAAMAGQVKFRKKLSRTLCSFQGKIGLGRRPGRRMRMLISLHKQATTTPKIRTAIQASDEPAWIVAECYGISEQTVWKWRKRNRVYDRSPTAHRLQTTLTPAQEAVAVALHKTLLSRGMIGRPWGGSS